MNHPDKPVNASFSRAGEVQDKPNEVISIVVTDEDDEPIGLLEKWNGDAWFYVETDSLKDTN